MHNITLNELEVMFSDLNPATWLDADLKILKDMLGDQLLTEEHLLFIQESKLLQLEANLRATLDPHDCLKILPELQRLRYRPFDDLLKAYPTLVSKLAAQLGKQVAPLVIQTDSILIDSRKYHPFCRSLVHVFRNIMDHGIEMPEERIKAGKSVIGSISCHVELLDRHLRLSISDDGKGMDVAEIRQKAIMRNICDKESALCMPDEEATQLIFTDFFSLREGVTGLSGRGIGLSAVKNELDKLNGKVTVRTESGKGTEFVFFFPCEDMDG
jgi:two-component system, chemotaxis family, sensor kinase CheA